jgi:hypothetical protein
VQAGALQVRIEPGGIRKIELRQLERLGHAARLSSSVALSWIEEDGSAARQATSPVPVTIRALPRRARSAYRESFTFVTESFIRFVRNTAD